MVETAVHTAGSGEVIAVDPCRRPIHVVHVVRRGKADGGMENGIVNVTNRLPAAGFRVSICALDSTQTFSSRIHRPDSEYFLLPKQGRGINWSLIPKLAQLLRRRHADLVHSHNWGTFLYAVLAARLARVPIIHGEHGKNLGEVDGDSTLKRMTKLFLGRRVNRVVTVSQALAAEWAGYGVPRAKIQCIPNGVDTGRFRPRSDAVRCRRNFGLPETGFLVGSIGRLDELKNYEVLVSALAQLAGKCPEMRVALLGEGPRKPMLQSQAEELGIRDRVYLLGHRPNPEEFLSALDVFALPSKSEGMSNVVLEAMAAGLPLVCADLPSHHEIFDPGQEGETVGPCTPDTLAEVLASLYRQPERRQALGCAARAKALARFDITRMVAAYQQLYAEHALPSRH
jgi:sugar transferase (PEP-CTERM/EpsH1 system associated)